MTQEQKIEIKHVFALRRKRQFTVSILLIILVVGLASMEERLKESAFVAANENILIAGFFCVILAALVFSFRNWRCPACSKYFGKNLNPRFCPACGVELR